MPQAIESLLDDQFAEGGVGHAGVLVAELARSGFGQRARPAVARRSAGARDGALIDARRVGGGVFDGSAVGGDVQIDAGVDEGSGIARVGLLKRPAVECDRADGAAEARLVVDADHTAGDGAIAGQCAVDGNDKGAAADLAEAARASQHGGDRRRLAAVDIDPSRGQRQAGAGASAERVVIRKGDRLRLIRRTHRDGCAAARDRRIQQHRIDAAGDGIGLPVRIVRVSGVGGARPDRLKFEEDQRLDLLVHDVEIDAARDAGANGMRGVHGGIEILPEPPRLGIVIAPYAVRVGEARRRDRIPALRIGARVGARQPQVVNVDTGVQLVARITAGDIDQRRGAAPLGGHDGVHKASDPVRELRLGGVGISRLQVQHRAQVAGRHVRAGDLEKVIRFVLGGREVSAQAHRIEGIVSVDTGEMVRPGEHSGGVGAGDVAGEARVVVAASARAGGAAG